MFGKQDDIADCQREVIDYSVVITEKEEFDFLKDQDFIRLFSGLHIKQSNV